MKNPETSNNAIGSGVCTSSEGGSSSFEEQRAELRARHRTDVKLNVFAEILRARPELSPTEAATAATAVYATLSA